MKQRLRNTGILADCDFHSARVFFIRCASLVFFLLLSFCVRAQSRPARGDSVMLELAKAQREGRLADAEKILVNAIHESEQSDPRNPQLAIYLGRLAFLYSQKQQFADAIALIQRALEIDQYVFGPADTRVANDFSALSGIYRRQGNNEQAEQSLKQALEVTRRNPHRDAYTIDGMVAVLSNLSSFYLSEHRTRDAEPLLQEAMQLCDATPQLKTPGYGCSFLGPLLAELYRAEGRTAEAEQVPPPDRGIPAEVERLNKQAQQYETDKNYEEAKGAYTRAIALLEKTRNPETTSDLFSDMNRLGQILEKQSEKEEAERQYLRALEMMEDGAGPKPPGSSMIKSLSFGLSNLTNLYRQENRLSDMEPIYWHALELQEKYLRPQDPAIAMTLATFAGVYKQEGDLLAKNGNGSDATTKYSESKRLFERALDIQQTNLGNDHPQLLMILDPYASVLRSLHEDTQAAEVQARIGAIHKKEPRPNQQK
jgi:tetratricopeptide (TPR) repeat protein